MPRILPAGIAVVVALCVALVPAAAWAGGTGQETCPAGFVSYIIPDDSLAGIYNGAAQAGRRGQLAPAFLPAGQYAVQAEGDSGPADNPPNAPYLAVCRNIHGRQSRPILASEQGQAGTNYQVPNSYMKGGPAVTAWLPAGTYRSVTSDTSTDATLQQVPAPAEIAWWRYALLALGIAGILLLGSIPIITRRHSRRRPRDVRARTP
jgi:hypothetical protein